MTRFDTKYKVTIPQSPTMTDSDMVDFITKAIAAYARYKRTIGEEPNIRLDNKNFRVEAI